MSKLAGHLFYLAGPIDDCKSSEDFTQWRDEMSEFLWGIEAGVLNPCDKPFDGVNEDQAFRDNIKNLKETEKYYELTEIIKDIVTQDLHMLDLSSAIILYVDTDVHMCGSWSEATYAALEKKPIIIFAKNGKKSVPNWVFGMCKHEVFFDNIEEVKSYLTKINNGQEAPLTSRWKFLDMNKIFGVGRET